jgi:hypothetical protein
MKKKFRDGIAENIKTHGWHGVAVFAAVDDPDADEMVPFTYSIGLTEQNLPEMVIFGIPSGGKPINSAIDDIKKNGIPEDGKLTDLDGVHCAYRVMPPKLASEQHTCQAEVYYGRSVPVTQIVWADENGKFPWDADCDSDVAKMQSQIIDFRKEVTAKLSMH